MIHVPGSSEGDIIRFHYATQNSMWFKVLLISGIFHLIFSDLSWLYVTADKKGLLYNFPILFLYHQVLSLCCIISMKNYPANLPILKKNHFDRLTSILLLPFITECCERIVSIFSEILLCSLSIESIPTLILLLLLHRTYSC